MLSYIVFNDKYISHFSEAFYYLFFYKDEAHARSGKEKNTIPLRDFCGFDYSPHYDKEDNVLILITSSQTIYLAFDYLPQRERWRQKFIQEFGEGQCQEGPIYCALLHSMIYCFQTFKRGYIVGVGVKQGHLIKNHVNNFECINFSNFTIFLYLRNRVFTCEILRNID